MVLCLSIGRKRIRIMNEENSRGGPAALATRHLCTVEFEVGGGIIGIGASPFGDQRLGYISGGRFFGRSEEHTSELQSLMRISYAVFCLKKQTIQTRTNYPHMNVIKQN